MFRWNSQTAVQSGSFNSLAAGLLTVIAIEETHRDAKTIKVFCHAQTVNHAVCESIKEIGKCEEYTCEREAS